MNTLNTAVILAGGLGTRLRTVVTDLPKPMAPIKDRPFLAYQLDYCYAQGIQTVFLSVGYKHECITRYFGNSYRGMALQYVIESKPMGTGGGLCFVLKQTHLQRPFLLCNGDTYFPVPLNELEQLRMEKNAAIVFSLFRTHDTQRYMGMHCTDEGRIIAFDNSTHEMSDSILANGGVYCINPQPLIPYLANYENSHSPVSLEQDIFPTFLEAEVRLFGKEIKQVFIDIGVPEDYHRAAEVILV